MAAWLAKFFSSPRASTQHAQEVPGLVTASIENAIRARFAPTRVIADDNVALPTPTRW
jgi:hypothetical protein